MRRSSFAILAALAALAGIGAACHSASSAGTGAAACQTLTSCCADLPAAQQVSCLSVVGGGSEAVCTEALITYAASCSGPTGTGPGSGSSCTMLLACCADMTGASAASCEAIAGTGVSATCASQLAAYSSANACRAVGTGPGASTGPGGSTGTGPASGSTVSGSGTTGPASGTGSGNPTGTTGTGTGSSSAGDAGTTPECTLPATSPSGGSCVTVVAANDAGTGIQCNPVTNAPCASGYACDVVISPSDETTVTGFMCFPPPNTATVCQTCGSSTAYCVGGETCLGTCAHYCCTKADCGNGTCMTGGYAPVSSALGICVTP